MILPRLNDFVSGLPEVFQRALHDQIEVQHVGSAAFGGGSHQKIVRGRPATIA
jgi:hypothetical protein